MEGATHEVYGVGKHFGLTNIMYIVVNANREEKVTVLQYLTAGLRTQSLDMLYSTSLTRYGKTVVTYVANIIS